jgi:uncharacterized protein
VKDVDVARKRIALTMKSGAIDTSGGARARPESAPMQRSSASPPRQTSEPPVENALAAALRRAQERK